MNININIQMEKKEVKEQWLSISVLGSMSQEGGRVLH